MSVQELSKHGRTIFMDTENWTHERDRMTWARVLSVSRRFVGSRLQSDLNLLVIETKE